MVDFGLAFFRVYSGVESLFAHDVLTRLRASLVATTALVTAICKGGKDETEDADHTEESEDLRQLLSVANTKFVEVS